MGETTWRTEPTTVETLADELWLAEKFQSNPAIAGSPRNSSRTSVEKQTYGGRALNGRWSHPGILRSIKLRMPHVGPRQSDYE